MSNCCDTTNHILYQENNWCRHEPKKEEKCWKEECCKCKCKCECDHEEHKKDEKECKASAQFVSGINLQPPAVGQEIIGCWPLGNVQPVEIGITAIADAKKIQLAGTNTILLQPGRYLIDAHALVANFDNYDPEGSDPIVTKLFVNGIPLEYTINSVDVVNQLFVLNSTQINKSNIIIVTQPNTTLQWMAGNTVSRDSHFDIYEASMTVTEL